MILALFRRLVLSSLSHPHLSLILLSLLLRLSTSLLLLLLRPLPSFRTDATPLSVPLSPALDPFVRWDAVHFVHLALFGYVREERTAAFGWGLTRGVMRLGGGTVAWMRGKEEVGADEVVLAGMVGSTLATTLASLVLYQLTALLFPSAPSPRPLFPLLTSTLFLLAPSRPTLHAAPYTEPFAALSTFGGMYFFAHSARSGEARSGGRRARGKRVLGETAAALAWAAGSAFRAQGALLGVGFFGWRYILQRPFRSGRFSLLKLATSLPPFLLLSLLSSSPFLLFQSHLHTLYCSPSPPPLSSPPAGADETWDVFRLERPRPWCAQGWGVGMSYGWVQREYWDIRPFAYWTPLQLPNFLLAFPVLALSLSACWGFYRANARDVLWSTLPFVPARFLPRSLPAPPKTLSTSRPFTHPPPTNSLTSSVLIPTTHLSLALSLLLLTTAHVQIALRVCVVDPVVFWGAAEMCLPLVGAFLTGEKREGEQGGRDKWARRWLWFCGVWGGVSVVLWAGWLPPA
ncbi:hypothetical protein JCM6882_004081 [Rhodosporidiobolus microsporus]